MTGQGLWQVPKGVPENLRYRRHVLSRARKDRALQRAIVEACRQDILFWINSFVYQYNPQQVGGEVGPFLTWDFQDDAVREILAAIQTGGRTDLVIEKSREMGASWLCLIVMTWIFLFHPWKKFLMISRSAEAVDKPEDPDCLFWKIDFILKYLPSWMAGGVTRRKMGFKNSNHSTITGQASTGKAGVGGRATAMFVDEFSQIDEGFEVLHRTADTTGCRIFNFTHTGLDTAAYEMSQRVDVRKLRMHWSQHPEKRRGLYRYDIEAKRVEHLDPAYVYPADFLFVMDGTPSGPFAGLRSPWYDAEEKRRASKRAVAMDLDIDPRGASSQFFDAVMIKMLQQSCCDPFWEGDVSYDRDTAEPISLVEVAGGPLKLWCNLNHHGLPPVATYAGGADIASGSGATPSCLSFSNVRTGEKVLEYADPFKDPKEFAFIAVALCQLFKGPEGEGVALAWEMQGPGIVFGNKVVELGYRNIYYRTDEFSLSKKVSDKPGWVPTAQNIRVLLEDYRQALAARLFMNRSWQALDECLSFVYGPQGRVKHGGEESPDDPTGARENHGDRVVADALDWKMARMLGAGKPRRPLEQPERRVGTSILWRREFRARQAELAEAW